MSGNTEKKFFVSNAPPGATVEEAVRMKKHNLATLSATIQSLTDSTELTVDVAGIRVVVRGRRSPYVSHQEVEAREGFRDIPQWMCLRNSKRGLAITPVDPGEMWRERNWLPLPATEKVAVWGDEGGYREVVVATELLVAQAPAHMVRSLLTELGNCPFVPKEVVEALTSQLLVWVAFPVRKTTGRWVCETLPDGGTKMFPEWVEIVAASQAASEEI